MIIILLSIMLYNNNFFYYSTVDTPPPQKKITPGATLCNYGFRKSKQDRPKKDNPITHWMRSSITRVCLVKQLLVMCTVIGSFSC